MKVKDVVVMKEVADDLNDGKAFYEQRESGIGEYFWDSLFADIESLVIYAGVYVREHGLYRMLSKRFPYAIYYEIVDEIAYVIAVLPMHRNPAWLKRKLQERG
ncbi:MAG: type II toxin-antitoxin system RelE/ParE family toxin [Syntrophobacteraceae bacterium]